MLADEGCEIEELLFSSFQTFDAARGTPHDKKHALFVEAERERRGAPPPPPLSPPATLHEQHTARMLHAPCCVPDYVHAARGPCVHTSIDLSWQPSSQ